MDVDLATKYDEQKLQMGMSRDSTRQEGKLSNKHGVKPTERLCVEARETCGTL